MKEYFKRISTACSKPTYALWWVFRLLMVYAFIAGFFKKPFDITDPLQVFANLVCMFLWEIFMMFPEKCALRHISPGFQSFFIVCTFLASFGGKFMNFYYDIRWWDSALHFIGGAAAVFYGYEYICAIMKKEKKGASLPIVLIGAVGFSFIAGSLWELFEFSFDQVAGILSGAPGDSQHWSLALAEGTPKIATLFDPIDPARWPIMDTMGDIVLNTLGAALSYVIIRLFPYRHKGKYKIDFEAKEQKQEVHC